MASGTSSAGVLDGELLAKLEQLLTCPISHVRLCFRFKTESLNTCVAAYPV